MKHPGGPFKMRKIHTLCLALTLFSAVAIAAGDRTPRLLTRIEGWVVDMSQARDHANAESAEAILEAHKKGAALVLLANDGKIYDLTDQERAAEHVGYMVRIFGRVDGNDLLDVGKYLKLEPDGTLSKDQPATEAEKAAGTGPKLRSQGGPGKAD